ncbi:MAG TPA: lipoyl(octanoyl) transferase LipB [Luteitalea sp.]|nr:lipoyl(octanoyl) transferase LipB [Luteitalea sp.]
MRPLRVQHAGLVPYEAGLALQADLVAARKADTVPDTLVLLQHPPVITLGVKVRQSREHVLASDEDLQTRGVALHEAGRGGDVTYHGPGQLVGYPVLDLKPDRQDAHKYVRDLEAVLIGVCAEYGLAADRKSGLTGVWVGEEKVAAIGVRLSRWVSSHGFALNVSTDLDHFGLIVPCGISDRGVTSLGKLLGQPPPMPDVEAHVVAHLCRVFDREVA